MIYILGLNGPPRCGKDSIGQAILQIMDNESMMPATTRSLSMPMRLRVYALLGIQYSLEHYETNKDIIQPVLNDTIRGAMIIDSEKHVKHRYGHQFWGKGLINGLKEINFNGLCVIPDIGFPAECETFLADRDVCFVNIEIERSKIAWGKDSRKYCGSPFKRFQNDRSIIDCADAILDCLLVHGWPLELKKNHGQTVQQ